jgi:predicted small integral membrane protein
MRNKKEITSLERKASLVWRLFIISLGGALFGMWADSNSWGDYWEVAVIALSVIASILAVILFAIGGAHLASKNTK